MIEIIGGRAGRYVRQPEGFRVFIPGPLPPDPPIQMDEEMQVLLSATDRAIGRLDAITEFVPNPDLFVAMYVRKEAVLSSQIEGTQASLTDLLEFESEAKRHKRVTDVQEVFNYVRAINFGLEQLAEMPLCLRLLRAIHAELLKGVRGGYRTPGEFRKSQNWIGPSSGTISEAAFVPPPAHEIPGAMGNLERFLHDDTPMPPLVKCGLAHAQFETIHPFLDGNGRLGRLLITFFLCWRGILTRPLLYLSVYFKRHRQEYYDRLQAVRDAGDWEGWIRFFLEGVRSASLEASETARKILDLREKHRTEVGRETRGSGAGLILLDRLFEFPMITVRQVADIIQRSYPVANDLTAAFVELGILSQAAERKRNRVFVYQPYLNLLEFGL